MLRNRTTGGVSTSDTGSARPIVSHMTSGGGYVPTTRAVRFRLTEDQHQQLKAGAADAGMTIQAFMEQRVFGEVRPRGASGARPYLKKQDEELPLTG